MQPPTLVELSDSKSKFKIGDEAYFDDEIVAAQQLMCLAIDSIR